MLVGGGAQARSARVRRAHHSDSKNPTRWLAFGALRLRLRRSSFLTPARSRQTRAAARHLRVPIRGSSMALPVPTTDRRETRHLSMGSSTVAAAEPRGPIRRPTCWLPAGAKAYWPPAAGQAHTRQRAVRTRPPPRQLEIAPGWNGVGGSSQAETAPGISPAPATRKARTMARSQTPTPARSIHSGDRDAFRRWVHLYRHALRHTGEAATAADVVQGALESVWNRQLIKNSEMSSLSSTGSHSTLPRHAWLFIRGTRLPVVPCKWSSRVPLPPKSRRFSVAAHS